MSHSIGSNPLWLLACLAAPLAAQTAPPIAPPAEADSDTDLMEEDAITVTASRERGTVLGNIAPEITLGPQDIRAIGASSIEELLQELAPQTRSGRGRGGGGPVVLINGKRVAGFAEIRNIPPEAIERTEIFPEEVSLKYGYRADQRVVNFVLRERFRAVTGEFEGGLATDGGRATTETDVTYLRIRNGTRFILDGEYETAALLLESDRGILATTPQRPYAIAGNIGAVTPGLEIDPALSLLAGRPLTVAPAAGTRSLADYTGAPNTTDIGRYRSLLPETRALSLGTSYASSIGSVSTTVSAGFDRSTSQARLGLPATSLVIPAGNPFSPFAGPVSLERYGADALLRDSTTTSARAGLTLAGNAFSWQWNLTANYVHAETDTRTDRGLDIAAAQVRTSANDPAFNPFGPVTGPLIQDRAHSNSDTLEAQLVTNGTLFALPGGEVSTAIRTGIQSRSLASESRRLGVDSFADLARTQGNVQASIDLPISSIRNNVLPALGNLSANLNVELEQLSDFGTLLTWGYGLNWTPIDSIQFIASVTNEEGAPTIQQLGDPQLLTPNVRVFDFLRGETVDISRLDGGNPNLAADSRRVVKLGLTAKPLAETDLTFTANFIDSRIDNPIASFPTATAELEAAFPDRFRRDAAGRLTQIDNRPVNFQRSDRQELRWGFTFSEPLEPSKAEREAAAARRATVEAARAARLAAAAAPGAAPDAAGAGQGTRSPDAAGAGPGDRGGDRAGRPGGPGGGRGPGGPGGRGLDGRLQLSIFHTWHLKEQIVIRDGVPVLDLLDGSATGSRGGQPRHEIEARAGIGKSGLGARLTVNWVSGTSVLTDPTGATTSPDDLFFGSFATANLRIFADLGQRPGLARRIPFLRGARVSLAVDNLFNNRLSVADRTGVTPIGYQPGLLDPLGRSVTLSFRKVFF